MTSIAQDHRRSLWRRVTRWGAPTSRRATATSQRVLLLTVADQGASSISNFALALVVAHYSSASALGVFAILTTSYVISQGLVRSLTSDCLLTRSEADGGLMSTYERAGYLAAIVLSVSAALLLLASSTVLPDSFKVTFVILAVSFPLMACQDYCRFIGISRYDPAYAIRLDVAWLVLFVLAYVVLRHAGLTTLPWLFGAWSGAGALVGLSTLRAHLARSGQPELLRFWVHSERAVGVRFAGQFMLVSSWTYFIVYLLVFVISVAGIGEFKLSQLSLGPITVMAVGVQSALIPLSAKRFQVSSHKAVRFLFLGGSATAAVTLAWTALIYALPPDTLTPIFGPAWPQARVIVPFMGLGFALAGFSGAATSGLRAMRAARENLRVALVMVPFQLVLCLGGAELYGTRGAAAGLVVAAAIYAVLGWWLLLKLAREFVPGVDAVVEDAVVEVAEP